MPESESRPLNVVCLATYFKGAQFIRECKSNGCNVILITKEKTLGEDWPRDSLADLIALPNDADTGLFIQLVSLLARQTKLDRIIALEEFDVITAALLREHLCMRGMNSSTARFFRDKLAMGVKAKAANIDVPEFVSLINHNELREFMGRVPPPWVIKPRSDVSAIGIRKAHTAGDVWQVIDEIDAREELRERSAHYLLAHFVPGEVFHVDSLVSGGRVIFAGANRYGRPPMEVAQQGGAYISHTLAQASADEERLLEINRKLIKTLGLENGAAHAEFIKSASDGRFYFLEVAARVGGAYIAEVLEAASGINLWREWAKLELYDEQSSKRVIPERREHAGIILSLAKHEYPDTAAYTDAEIVYRVKKRHHVGLIVRSPKLERVTELLDEFARRFANDFIAVEPPLERVE
jgi:biotin carboxylase